MALLLSRCLLMLAALSLAAAPAKLSKEEAARRDKLLQESKRHSDYWEARDRAELVRPAPPGFKPPFKGKKVLLRLIPRDKILHSGQEFWYRLELINIGTKPIKWSGDEGAFFKSGDLQPMGKIRFFVVEPSGKRLELLGPEHGLGGSGDSALRFPKGMSEKERDEFMARLNDPGRGELSVGLKPGETLISRGGPDPSDEETVALIEAGKDPDTVPRGAYRSLDTRYRFEVPGAYKVQVTMENPAPPPGHWSEEYPDIREKWVLGITESNLAKFEVRP